MLLVVALTLCASPVSAQAEVTWTSGNCYANYTFMSSPGPIGCYSYCGCTDEINEWDLVLLASAGWDCTMDVATGTVSANADGGGLGGAASIVPNSYNPFSGGSSLLFLNYYNSCDGMSINLGVTAYTDQC